MTAEGSYENGEWDRSKAKPSRFNESEPSPVGKKIGGVGLQGSAATFERLGYSAEQKGSVGRLKQRRIAGRQKSPVCGNANRITKQNQQNGGAHPQSCASFGQKGTGQHAARFSRPAAGSSAGPWPPASASAPGLWTRDDQRLSHAMARAIAVIRPTVGRMLTRRW